MVQAQERSEEEAQHLYGLLDRYSQNLRVTERQIAMHDPGLVPIHLLNQKSSLEEEKARILQRIQHLERQTTEDCAVSMPEISARFLLESLPTGVLHLYSRDNLPLIRFTVSNRSQTPKRVIVSSHIEQFSYSRSDTVNLAPGQSQAITQLPVFKLDEVSRIYEVRKAVLHTRANCVESGRELLVFSQDYDIRFLARDVIVWAVVVDKDTVHDLSRHIAAWVTPNAPRIREMMRHAADYAPMGQMWGYQGHGTTEHRAALARCQVKAIFEALKARGNITYVNSPISFGRKANAVQQRVNLPEDSLTYRQANCIDGAVLYASLIERAAMNPVILLIPGHALVGWETWAQSGRYEFLETTMTGTHTFEQAFQRGMQEFKNAKPLLGRPLFSPGGSAILLETRALHKAGVLPSE